MADVINFRYPATAPRACGWAALLAGCLTTVSVSAEVQAPVTPPPAVASDSQSRVAPPADPRLAALRGMVLGGGGSMPDLVAALQRILADDPRQAEAHLLLGILYTRTDALDLAAEGIAEFRQALALAPDSLETRLYLGRAYLDAGQARRAADELQAAADRAPDRADVVTWLAEAERQLGHPDRSVELGRRALQLDPDQANARYHLGRALLDLGRPDEAIVELEPAAARAADDLPDVLEQLGLAYLDAGRQADALSALLQAASLAPTLPTLRVALARAYRTDGQLDKAEEQLGFAMRIIENFRAEVVRGGQQAPAGMAADFVRQVEVDALAERGRLLDARAALNRATGGIR